MSKGEIIFLLFSYVFTFCGGLFTGSDDRPFLFICLVMAVECSIVAFL